MISFLKAVALAYGRRYDDMSRFCFVFPNKRSGTFFLKYLRSVSYDSPKTDESPKAESQDTGLSVNPKPKIRNLKVKIAPEIYSITDFVERIGDSVVDNHISLLLTLYKCYCSLLPESKRPDFDSFRPWGDTVLSDFNEVGMNCVDTEALFRNLLDHKQISTDFLSEEQKQIMSEYFGHTAVEGDGESFWNHFNNPNMDPAEADESKIPLRKKFLKLWETLSPLYDLFNKTLEKKGVTTSAGAYREALIRLESEGRDALPWEKVVFVGFNALTRVEIDIFNNLKAFGTMDSGPHPEDMIADFIWDATGPILSNKVDSSGGRNSAARFVTANRKRFPEPEWALPTLSRSDSDRLPAKMRSIASPSNVLQAKIAAELVGELYEECGAKDIKAAKVAVVLPDENLLLPFMYGLPENVNDVNLTMGYPLKLTSVASFIGLLRNALRSSRHRKGLTVFYFPDLKLLLTHPIVRVLGGTRECDAFVERGEKYNQILVSANDLTYHIPGLAKMFSVPQAKESALVTLDYIEGLLRGAADAISSADRGLLKSELDSKYIEDYLAGIRPLRNVMEEYKVTMSRDTVFALIQKMTSSLRVNFEGEPLRGLQVMGLLETRSLDFDIVIIPSLNERILPMKSHARTFIPNSLRVAYGLPPATYAENIFAYYFYRLISRAKEVVLIHDARAASGLRSGGVSRYVHQLRYLFAPGHLKEEVRSFSVTDLTVVPEPIEKTENVMEQLREYLVDSENPEAERKKRVLSATAVNDYCRCEKLFFFKHLSRIPERSETLLPVDAVKVGNIVHKAMEILYSPKIGESRPHRITTEYLDQLLFTNKRELMLLITELTVKELKLPCDIKAAMESDYHVMRETAEDMVRAILLNDRKLAADNGGSIEVLGCEEAGTEEMPIGDGRKVYFRYSIDRADRIGNCFRLVDYKTGKIHMSGEGFDEMFDGNSKRLTNFLQLMTYAGIARRIWPAETAGGVRMVTYNVIAMMEEASKMEKMIGPSFKYEEDNGKVKVSETFDSDSMGHRVKKEGRKTVSEELITKDEIRDEFDTRLKAKIDSIFDKPEFSPTAKVSDCEYCSFAGYCLR